MSNQQFVFLFIFLGVVSFYGCDDVSGKTSDSSEAREERIYFDNGQLKTVVKIDDQKRRHGWSKTYYPNGNMRLAIRYVHGDKTKSIRYYETGEKYMETFYENNLINGVRTKYWDNGKIRSTQTFKYGAPGTDLEEFNKKGIKLKKYDKLVVRQIDRMEVSGQYIVEVYFSDKPRNGKYYVGKLHEGKFLTSSTEALPISNGKGRLVYRPLPGQFTMQQVTLVGVYKTRLDNRYIDSKVVNIAIDSY